MGRDFEVDITNPERAVEFMQVFGRTRVNVESPMPHYAVLPGRGKCKIFKLDVKLISSEERQKLAEFISGKFHLPLKTVESELETNGLPILDEDCTVIIANPQRWVG